MDQELLVRQIMQEVMKNMQGSAAACECESKVTVEDYPLGEKKPELIKSASGKSLNDLTLQGVIDGKLDAKDFRITKETLELQAQVAESAGRGFFATNLRRAGELIQYLMQDFLRFITLLDHIVQQKLNYMQSVMS